MGGFQSETPITSIPTFLSAATPEELRRLMLETNIKHSTVFKYFDIKQALDKKWYAWYFIDITPQTIQIREAN
jgi:hypothetical protein